MGSDKKARVVALTVAVLLLVGSAACSQGEAAPAASRSSTPAPSYGPNVVHLDGLREIHFGDTEALLTQRGLLAPESEAEPCGPSFVAIPEASPVFFEGRLVQIWAEPPLQTPEGVGVGTPLDDARAVYPTAHKLTAPADSYRFDGLLVTEGDRAYLFLHDGRAVQKVIVGYAEQARMLFEADVYDLC
ncbi:MAG TPA: hypothetical protein VFX61_13210 [Micromonosporaceae bacterium]|nr:hypothetical protein [Micromonosporaceae bacterium]